MKGKREFITSGTIYTILGFLPTASRFFLFPLFLHYLSPDDFALISLNTMVASILPTFMTLGLEASMNRFYFDFVKYPKIEKAFVSTLVISISVFAVIIGLVFVAIGPQLFLISFKSPRFTFFPFGITALLSAIPGALSSLYLNYLRCRKDLKNYIALNLGFFILMMLGDIFGIVVFKMRVEHLVWIKPLITSPFILIGTFVLLFKIGVHFDRRLLRIAMSYSTPLLPHIIFGLVFIYADRIMIENNLNLTYLAIYNTTMAISTIIDTFEQALRNATFPNIYGLLKENVYTNIGPIGRIHTINGLIIMSIMSAIVLCTPFGAYCLLKQVYRPLIYLVPFALIISVVRFYYIVYAEPLFFFKKVQYVSLSTVTQGCFALLLNFLLIPRFGLIGALSANIISKLIQVAIVYYFTTTIKAFKYKLNFIMTAIFILIVIQLAISFVSRQYMDSKIFIQAIDCIPVIFTFCVLAYFVRRNNISLKNLW
jgi:O-antigen/teichoic acid export membrane protein